MSKLENNFKECAIEVYHWLNGVGDFSTISYEARVLWALLPSKSYQERYQAVIDEYLTNKENGTA